MEHSGSHLVSEAGTASPARHENSNTERMILMLVLAVDSADGALLPATFKAMSHSLHLSTAGLAALSSAQTITYSLALPCWASMMRYFPARDLLVVGCFLWGSAMGCIAYSTSFESQFALRLLNGAALASVTPLGNAMLYETVPEAERGRAFGILGGVCSVVQMLVGAAATALQSVSFYGTGGWRLAHVMVSAASFMVAWSLYFGTRPAQPTPPPKNTSCLGEQMQAASRVFKKPSLVIMLFQTMVCTMASSSMVFLALYFQLSGYSDVQTSVLGLYSGLGAIAGSFLAGFLGDRAAQLSPMSGRIAVAQTSVLLGIASFAWMMIIPARTSNFVHLAKACFVFNLTSAWTGPATRQPLFGALFPKGRELARVLALYAALTGVVSSFFGAPVAALLSQSFGLRLTGHGTAAGLKAHNVSALRNALLCMTMLPWFLTVLSWLPLYQLVPRDCCQDDAGDLEESCDQRPSLSGSALIQADATGELDELGVLSDSGM